MNITDEMRDAIHPITELLALPAALMEDVTISRKALQNDIGNLFLRRSYVKTVFSAVEGTISVHKQICVGPISQALTDQFELGEIVLLKEETYGVDDKGNLKNSPSFINLRENVRFTFRILEKVYRIKLSSGFGDTGWTSFQNAIKTRNRITHPKHYTDLNVSDQELKEVNDAFTWYHNNSTHYLKKVRSIIAEMLETLRVNSEMSNIDISDEALGFKGSAD